MKKIIVLFIAALAITAGCTKKNVNNETIDKWNGYSPLKDGELVRTLWAGQHDSAGYVTYGIDENANFYATFTTVDGWQMSETHFFAGDKGDMPVNKPGKPKIGKFPYGDEFNSWVTEVTYTIELIDLPQAEEDGFVAAAHAVVHNINTGKQETAWGFGDYVFSDKGWGWYTTYWYQQEQNPFYILYGTTYDDGFMTLYRIDATNGIADTIYDETLGSDVVAVDGNAYDPTNALFYFTTKTNTGITTLNTLDLNDETAPSSSVGTLSDEVTNATFFDGNYYYVNTTNVIMSVSFDQSGNITQETPVDTIPSSINISDIAYDPDGNHIYFIGDYNTNVELIDFDITDNTYGTVAIQGVSFDSNTQIAYGDDGSLYTVFSNDTGSSIVGTLQPESGIVTVIEESGVVPLPFSDLAGGPTM